MMKIAVIIIMLLSSACAARSDDVQSLQELVDGYHFIRPYEENVFVCADMACANQAFLLERGYESKIAIVTYESDPNYRHCVALVTVQNGWACLDTRVKNLGGRTLNSSLGKVTSPDGILEIVDSPEELVEFDRGIKEGIRGPYLRNVIAPNARIPSLPPIFAR